MNNLTYNRTNCPRWKCNCSLNYHELFCKYAEKMESAREKVENDISDFIKEEWNENLEICVELEDTGLVTIFVGRPVKEDCFNQFIIQPICKKYNLKLQYTEVVKGVCPYMEWGLSSDS